MWTIFYFAYAIYAIFIYYKINLIFKKYSFLNNPETQINPEYAPFTRKDFHKWNKTTFLLCGLVLLPIRIIIAFTSIVLAAAILKLNAMIFKIKNYQDPQPAIFIKICKITLRVLGRLILFCWGYFKISHKVKKVTPSNASYFNITEDVKHATIVCNHTAFIDIFLFFCQERPVSFISNQAVQHYPLVGIIAKTIQCVFVNRINKESRAKCLDDLKNRAGSVRTHPDSKLFDLTQSRFQPIGHFCGRNDHQWGGSDSIQKGTI